MPEVVSPKTGDKVHWDTVFPIWKIEGNDEYQTINSILYQIALNNRMGGQTIEELKASIMASGLKTIDKKLSDNLLALRKLDNEKDSISDDKKLLLENRQAIWANWGEFAYYVENVFENADTPYRASK